MYYGVEQLDMKTALFIALAGFLTVIAILIFMSLIIRFISKGIVLTENISEKRKSKKNAGAAANEPAVSETGYVPAKRKTTPGFVELIDVDEPTAAVIMAIVSSKTGIPPERLAFSSIKLIGEAKTNEV